MSSAARLRWIRFTVRLAISGLSLLLFVMHVAGTPRFEIIDRVENYLYDVRIQLTMPDTLDDRIVIIDIDEASQVELGQWPWPRDTLGGLVNRLFDDYGIQVLGFDALFAEAEETSAERLLNELARSERKEDAAIMKRLEELQAAQNSNIGFSESLIARDVVTGFVFKDSLASNEPESTGALPPPLISKSELDGVTVPFIAAAGYAGNLANLQENAAAGGFFDSPIIDSDGVFRRAPLVQQYKGDLYPSLALAVARIVMGSPPVGLRFAANKKGRMSGIDLESFRLGELDIPVNERVAVFIPFRGRQGSFPYVSAKDVINGNVAAEVLEGKIALLGASAAGLMDLRSTPVGQRYIGVEAHANLIAGLLDGEIRQQPAYSDGLEVVFLILIGLMMAIVLPQLAAVSGLLFVAVILAATTAANLWMWSSLGLVVPLASLLSYTLVVSLFHINYGFFIESRNKRHLSKIFGQYIPKSLVAEMDASGEDVSLEGETRTMSVLFSDVRGFTTISENLDARELTQLMNEFLTPITRVIQQHRGTIDKYMGDAVMAFWGAPLADEDHAEHALLAGLDMIRAVSDLKPLFVEKGWPPIKVGVGVASGEMNVGNMGSEFRIAYTVMGDTVNLGSRLEGLTKQYGVDMLVNESTMRLVPGFAFREVDLVRVKGKRKPVAIFEPVGLKDSITVSEMESLALYSDALVAYRSQDWDSAAGIFNTLKERQDHLLYNVYLDRIGGFRSQPPVDDWDGVFEHLSK